MDGESLLWKLRSTSKDDVLDALAQLRRQRDTPPPSEVADRCLELLESPDSEIRHETLAALCLHWGERRALPIIFAMLEGREADPDVLALAARALGSMAKQHGPLGEKALQVLAHVALDEKANAELRGIAYISARATAGLLTPQEYARLPEDIHQLDVDWEWLLHSAAG